ncbi:MAG: FtsX-like permease family protein [Bacteroidales bacterium]|jgi:putative ABC transport system permease protein|nr:FtsX-like permease family protein [Bacteroidales bacterium]
MIKFLFKGLIRDKNRSLLPFLVTMIGVMLTVVFHAWMTGVIGNSIEFNARFSSGHVKIMTRAYAENSAQSPNDLAILGTDTLTALLRDKWPELEFAERIHFNGIIDVPDSAGETRAQGPAMGFAIDMLSGNMIESERLNIPSSLKSGRLPQKSTEALLSRQFADKLQVVPGDMVTLVGSSMYGELVMYNFIVSGTVDFGTTALDRGTIIADISDVREALNMENAAGEIVGFFRNGSYDEEKASAISDLFNGQYTSDDDEFSPLMTRLSQDKTMGFMVEYSGKLQGLLVAVFMIAMSLILWNAGLLGGLRRYGEFGMRLAIGEEKGHVYKTMMMESFLIGLFGTIAGVTVGMVVALYLQNHGVNLGAMMKNAAIMMPSVFRAHITPATWYIGFIPGLLSTQIGTMLAGAGIYKRQTAQLFKELEA